MMKCIIIFLSFSILVFSYVEAKEIKLNEKVDIILVSNYRIVKNAGTYNYDSNNPLYLNNKIYIYGDAYSKNYNLFLIGFGLKYEPLKFLALTFLYESSLNDITVGSTEITNIRYAANAGPLPKSDSMITSFQSVKLLVNYIKDISCCLDLSFGIGIVRHIAYIEPGNLDFRLSTKQNALIYQVGVEYGLTERVGLSFNIDYESKDELDFPNFTQKINPLSFETELSFSF